MIVIVCDVVCWMTVVVIDCDVVIVLDDSGRHRL
jgi:hypothetical protein